MNITDQYKEAYACYRQEDQTLHSTYRQYLLVISALLYFTITQDDLFISQATGVIAIVISIIFIAYVDRISFYSSYWLALKNEVLSKMDDDNLIIEEKHYRQYEKNYYEDANNLKITGKTILKTFLYGGIILFLSIIFLRTINVF